MTNFEQVELLYNQFSNLSDEIRELAEKEDYVAAFERLGLKDNLTKELIRAKKTIKCSEDERKILQTTEKNLQEKDKENIRILTLIKEKMRAELNVTKKKVKMNSAYNNNPENQAGTFFDTIE